MGRKGQSITLSISEREKQQLEILAAELGMTWGDKPNISRLLKAIAQRKLLIASNHDWTQERIQALEKARQGLIDLGKTQDAQEIARILVQRSELNTHFRREIENFLDTPQIAWRQQVDQYIKTRQPFKLIYRDAADREFQYNVTHAQIQFIERRQYLVCRCDETEGNQDIPELQHNWTFRLDRIQEAAITSIERQWAPDLQKVPVEFELSGGLAFAYQDSKNRDRFIGELTGDPPVRRVIRPIYNTFWFFRSIAAYWEDCIIINPENVRRLYLEKVKLLYKKYYRE